MAFSKFLKNYVGLNMNHTLKNSLLFLLVLAVALLALKLVMSDLGNRKDNSQVDSSIVVERMRKVLKLVTVEENFSEIMSYKDFDYIDFPGFRKDALIRVNAKVSVGYNLDSLKITTNEKDKVIVVEHMPRPEVLSVDSDIRYENMDEGWFTHFSEQDLTKLNSIAKQKIRQKALNAEVIRQAEEQKNDLFELLFYLARQNGYKIMIEGSELKGINATVKQ